MKWPLKNWQLIGALVELREGDGRFRRKERLVVVSMRACKLQLVDLRRPSRTLCIHQQGVLLVALCGGKKPER